MAPNSAIVTPSVLKWARERARLDLDTAAKRISRTQEEVAEWERGDSQPTVAQARKLAHLYKFSLAVFYLPEPPTEFEILRDFRQLRSSLSQDFSAELALLIRQIQMRQTWISEQHRLNGMPKLKFVGSYTENSPESSVVRSIRETVGISADQSFHWCSTSEALRVWIEHVESIGVFVIRERVVSSDEARGMALTDAYAPFVFLNSNDSKSACLFTLVHELVHLWINCPGVSDLRRDYENNANSESNVESFCNRVASGILLEHRLLQETWNSIDKSVELEKQIRWIASKFCVSEEVVARRLLEMQVIRDVEYERLRQCYAERWEVTCSIRRQRAKERKGGPEHYIRRLFSNGTRFTGSVVDAAANGQIGLRDACHLLGMKIGSYRKTEQELKRRRNASSESVNE